MSERPLATSRQAVATITACSPRTAYSSITHPRGAAIPSSRKITRTPIRIKLGLKIDYDRAAL